MQNSPIVTVDGPSGAGKGTLSSMLAQAYNWHFLDSGAIYRVLAMAAMHHEIDFDDIDGLIPLASGLDVKFNTTESGNRVILEGEDVSDDIRREEVGVAASKIAAVPLVRESLLRRQRAFADSPGLIADGRDMGTVVFPQALAKIFLTASAEARAERRYEQLKAMGQDVKISRLLSDIQLRDERDSSRSAAPLRAADGALVIDSTVLSIKQVFEKSKEFIDFKIFGNDK